MFHSTQQHGFSRAARSERARLWRSAIAQQLYATLDQPNEQMLFEKMLIAQELTETDVRALKQRWCRERNRHESLVRFLNRKGWLTSGGRCREDACSDDEPHTPIPVLTDQALMELRGKPAIRTDSQKTFAFVSGYTAFARQ
jgi:hypothetical protein